ncbi:hypothetical protein L249_6410 [Ophiocordyceps polyrhachis-furcata BCC 54312]|uniref:Peroxisomal membrane protein PEX17 n=1 Tax=Ophiocordyceps polyrhachis-furcata BCC 54312 TaxID=1330021 RepID=A0A367LJN3_9HYPO|nr:hypothetical protein L249_6410 [Ophiocordyceps polyrhachis-furcata BCC 54312]
MPADRLLNTLLQRYRDVHDATTTDQIIGTTAHLLGRLSNPLNLGLLTSQLLTAPAVWHRHDGSPTAMRIIGIYKTAATNVRDAVPGVRRMGCDEWARAVVRGADDRSRPWRHLLVLTGVLVGMEAEDGSSLSWRLRRTLRQAVVTATNLALEHVVQDGHPAATSIITALIFAFPLLSEDDRCGIDCSALLPIAVSAMIGEDGFRHGGFLAAVGKDTSGGAPHLLHWPPDTPSHQLLKEMEGRSLMMNMGPLSKLAAFATQHARTSAAVLEAHHALFLFTGNVLDGWRKTALSGIDPDPEQGHLSIETRQTTWPLLCHVLRKLMFSSVALLQAIVSRSLVDPGMKADAMAPSVAAKSLHILRHLFFISSRDGNNGFEVYTFSYLTSIDVLSRYPDATHGFLQNLQQKSSAGLPSSHLERSLDLFYLNVAEHVPLVLSTESCETLIIQPAVSYLSHQGAMSPFMMDVFESAHSAILSVLSCPQLSSLTMEMAPFYLVKLFESFPRYISPRQFRVAFQTVMEIVSPPFPIAGLRPDLSETLLEMLRSMLTKASNKPLDSSSWLGTAQSREPSARVSEESALVMTLVDSLPFLPLHLMEEWLTIAAQLLGGIADPVLKAPVRQRFLDILVNGDLDVERAAIGVAWWGTRGGREAVLNGDVGDPAMMSGALGETQSRL